MRTSKRRGVVLNIEPLGQRIMPFTKTWTGQDNNHPGAFDWGANWAGGTAPGIADDVVFDGQTSNVSCVNAHGTSFSSIKIQGGYTGTVTITNASFGANYVDLGNGGTDVSMVFNPGASLQT